MSNTHDSLSLFNLETMSGVSPGARTQVMQRVRLAPAHPGGEATWARLLWYGGQEDAGPVAGRTCVAQLQQPGAPNAWQDAALVQLPDALAGAFNRDLQAALRSQGWELRACGSCTFWQPLAAVNPDGLPTGACTWRAAAPGAPQPPAPLAVQSNLALDCPHWQPADRPPAASALGPAVAAQPTLTLPKAAEVTAQPPTLRDRLLGRFRRPPSPHPAEQGWAERLMERSGVGAGTEPCYACQGRIANLGALTVETDEGDKQTYSVWRCRTCYTTYLNSWIDRWERLDSLETEESYYRIAPGEAAEVLAVIDRVAGGEHPAGRQARTEQRAWFAAFTASRTPLSHQIKQGR